MVLMLFRTLILAAAVIVLPALPQSGFALPIEDSEAEPQPGVIRLAGISDGDLVTLDGEAIPVEGLRRSRFNLLIAPGIYTLKVRSAATGRTCTSHVVVAEERVVEPACTRRPGTLLADSRSKSGESPNGN